MTEPMRRHAQATLHDAFERLACERPPLARQKERATLTRPCQRRPRVAHVRLEGGRGTAHRHDAHLLSFAVADEQRAIFEVCIIDRESTQFAVADAGHDEHFEDRANRAERSVSCRRSTRPQARCPHADDDL